MSVSITCEHLCKKFGDNTVIKDLSLKIRDTEFFTLLGPSGCGKTTLLRMIIGFNSIEGGTIYFNDKPVNDIPANKRNIGMVFQNYALFPNMSAFDNVAFGLKNRNVKRPEIRRRVDEMLKTVKIESLRDRRPEEMSGGQQQRVALARAIVIHPDMLLMDEPLSNLDAKLRVEMRNAIREIQHSVGITTVYVTHDQEEAMAVSDRIAVMNGGIIQQVGTPRDIYRRPSNMFVARFIGRTNILPAEIAVNGSHRGVKLENGRFIPMDNLLDCCEAGQKVQLSVRPEEFELDPSGNGVIGGTVRSSVFLGHNTTYLIDLPGGETLDVLEPPGQKDTIGDHREVTLGLKAELFNVFTLDGERNLVKGVRNDLEEDQAF